MIDKGIDDELSPDAYYLLIKLMKLAPNECNSNKYLREKTNFSKRRYDRAKAELVSKKYLETKQLYDNYYAFYIGKESTEIYKTRFKKSNNRHEQRELQELKRSLDDTKAELSKSG
jgi:uncharacterized membrane-anchored protein YhcB (DUF1043 family)